MSKTPVYDARHLFFIGRELVTILQNKVCMVGSPVAFHDPELAESKGRFRIRTMVEINGTQQIMMVYPLRFCTLIRSR